MSIVPILDLLTSHLSQKHHQQVGKKGGVELIFPGVHCDVGGAYKEGRPDNPKRIDATILKSSLEPLKEELIQTSWLFPGELTVIQDSIFRLIVNNFRLEGNRSKIRNQYSYIPLHIMAEFCKIKNLQIEDKIYEFKNFKANWINGNKQFLEAIKAKLHAYSFDGANAFVYEEPHLHIEPPIVYDSRSPNASIYIAERNQRQIDGQRKMNAEAEKKNEYIKFLRKAVFFAHSQLCIRIIPLKL